MNQIKGDEGGTFWLRWPRRGRRRDARRDVAERKSWWVSRTNSPEHESDNWKCRMTNSMNEATLENDPREDNTHCCEHEDTAKELRLIETTAATTPSHCLNSNSKGRYLDIFSVFQIQVLGLSLCWAPTV